MANNVEISQIGDGHSTSGIQTGSTNHLRVHQVSEGTEGIADVSASQEGDENEADILQEGRSESILSQNGDGNRVLGTQIGTGHKYSIAQEGDGNEVTVVQEGSDHSLRPTQTGNKNIVNGSQMGTSNAALLEQTGMNNVINVAQAD